VQLLILQQARAPDGLLCGAGVREQIEAIISSTSLCSADPIQDLASSTAAKYVRLRNIRTLLQLPLPPFVPDSTMAIPFMRDGNIFVVGTCSADRLPWSVDAIPGRQGDGSTDQVWPRLPLE